MYKRVFIAAAIGVLMYGCTKLGITQLEKNEDDFLTLDLTGMSMEQREMAQDMIGQLLTLVKEGKTSEEVLKALQDLEAKKITRYRIEAGSSPFRGVETAKVTIIEFSDFQCPFSKRVQATLNALVEKYPQVIKHVFKQHPLPFHKDAGLAAEAALAAGAQGKFWEMHDILFENQNRLGEAQLFEYAQVIGLDVEKFKADLASHKFKPQVDSEIKEATTLGATGTPAFFINGRFLSGAKPMEEFTAIIDEELSGKKIPFKWGTNVQEERKLAQRVEEDPNKIYTVPIGGAPVKGPAQAPVTIVAFNDFQCPFSKRVQPTLEQLMTTYPNQIKLVFKNYPLGFHKDAVLAAEAALAAGAQGKFWEMHDIIFANQQRINIENLKEYAQELKLNMTKFNSDLENHKYKPVIDEDIKLANELGVRGTPTVFINGRKLVGAKPIDEFKKLIQPILDEATEK